MHVGYLVIKRVRVVPDVKHLKNELDPMKKARLIEAAKGQARYFTESDVVYAIIFAEKLLLF